MPFSFFHAGYPLFFSRTPFSPLFPRKSKISPLPFTLHVQVSAHFEWTTSEDPDALHLYFSRKGEKGPPIIFLPPHFYQLVPVTPPPPTRPSSIQIQSRPGPFLTTKRSGKCTSNVLSMRQPDRVPFIYIRNGRGYTTLLRMMVARASPVWRKCLAPFRSFPLQLLIPSSRQKNPETTAVPF